MKRPNMTEPMTDPTRTAALHLLTAVLDRRRTLEEALDALPKLDLRDRAAAHRLAATVLRRLGSLDAVLEPFLKKSPPDPVRHILRLGAAGLLLLETPPHAAVATAVSLARAQKLTPFAGLVNAVLRRVATAGPDTLADLDCPRLDTPAWLWSAWGANARAIALAHQTEAPLDLTMKPGTEPPPGGETLPTGSIRYPAGTRITELPGFTDGNFWAQDAAAAMPARLLAPRQGERIADLCAAPGGKTAQLAAAGANVVSVERDPVRIDRLKENLARLRFTADCVQADAADWQPAEKFDAILLDAPCSATGTIRRHPDVPHLKRSNDIPGLAQAQDRLIDAAAKLLKPGGRLIYAVCSLQPEEGPVHFHGARLATTLAKGALRHAPFSPEELNTLPEARDADGNFRSHPGLWADRGGMDGFFAARLIKP